MSLPILKRLVSLGYNRAIWNIHEVLHKEYDICDHYNGEEFDIVKMISNLEHDSPIFETSHVNCYCRLSCFSTTNSELDTIIIDWQGGYDEGLKLDREDKTDRRNKWQQKFNEYRAKLEDIRNNQYITGVYSEPDSGIYSFDYTIYGDSNNYYYQQNNIQELNDRVLDIILTTAQRYKITVEDAVPSAMHYIVTTDNSLHDYDFSITDFYELDWVLVKRLNWLNELMYELNNLENWLLECNRQINDLLLKIETNQDNYRQNQNQQQINMNNQQQPNPYDIDINDTNNEFFK